MKLIANSNEKPRVQLHLAIYDTFRLAVTTLNGRINY